MFVYEGHRVKVKVSRSKKVNKSVFPQWRSEWAIGSPVDWQGPSDYTEFWVIGNNSGSNSGSINHIAMKFACSMMFSAMVDQMVWPPSLSHDLKWPRVTKCTHSRVVGLRLEGNLVSLVCMRIAIVQWLTWRCINQVNIDTRYASQRASSEHCFKNPQKSWA